MTCPKCQEGFVLPGEPTGSIQQDYRGAYHAPAPNGEPSKRAILFLTDGFGLPLKNCKIMADNLAERLECDVWPLISVNNLSAPDRAGVKLSILDWIKFILFTGIPNIPAYISSRPSVADERVVSFIDLLKEKKNYEKLGVVGYCYGGSASVRFAGTSYVDSAVVCHPGGCSLKQVEAIRVPISWACAEDDLFWPHDRRMKTEAILAARKDKDNFVEYEFRDYKGTAHGFAARPNLSLPEIKEAHEQAFEQTVEWFQKTLIV
ncbi:dienelactone hydrolase endo-1,3,1,4-beta-D-glucanase [Flammula alnicola]|nr:dienelactone hydrolase endo-1,3,1,4-beta-D-glucanase [Flammula alnicola]